MTDIESRLRAMDLRPPRDLPARALAGAAGARTRRRGLPALLAAAAVAVVLAGYTALALATARPSDAAAVGGYGVGEGCWFVRDSGGLHFHIGGWYHGLPALCTSERRNDPGSERR
jgi:hypothetical protein